MTYQTPVVKDYGRITEVTAAQGDGDYTDRDFPILTPRALLTFS